MGEGESGQHKVCLSSRVQVVLPKILGSLSIINRTSAEFSRKKDVQQLTAVSEQQKKRVRFKLGLVWLGSEMSTGLIHFYFG